MATRRLSNLQERSIAHATRRLNIWCGAVRSGKTIASLLRWLIYVRQAPRGGALVVCAKTLDTAYRNVFAVLQDPAVTGAAAEHVHYTRGASTATILGRHIEVITANNILAEGRLRGLTCAGAYVDEITLLPESFFTQLLARLSVAGAKLFGTTNPDGPNHWLRQRFLLRESELDLAQWHFGLDDNPSLDPAYVRSLKAEYTGLWYRRMINGEWCLAEGAVYDMWDPARHVVGELPVITRWIAVGIDHGVRNPFAALALGLGVDGRLYFTREYRYDSTLRNRQNTDAEYSRDLRKWLAEHPIPKTDLLGISPEKIIVDPAAAGFRAQLRFDGVAGLTLGDNAVVDGIRTVSSLLAVGALGIHFSCEGWINEITGYSWDDKAAQRGDDQPIKVDDHSLDAGRYALHTTRRTWQYALAPEYRLAA